MGPLRVLTRAVTYSFIFFAGYGLPFGLLFKYSQALAISLVAGLGLGIILGSEYAVRGRLQSQERTGSIWLPYLFGLLRGITFGLVGGLLFGVAFGLTFALLSAIGLMTVYAFRFSPSHAYHPHNALIYVPMS